MLTTALCATVEAALNRLLQLEPRLLQLLAPLKGQLLRIELRGTPFTPTLRFEADRIAILCHFDGVSDATLSGPPLALLRLLQERPGSELFGSGAVQIQGRVELVQQVQRLMQQLNIDWEEWLSHFSGDGVAHAAGRRVEAVGAWLKRTADHSRFQLHHYLHYEAETLPPKWEIDEFIEAVDRFRSDVERIEARLNALTPPTLRRESP